MSKNGILVSFSIKKDVSEEAETLWQVARLQPAKQEHYFVANDIASLQAIHDCNTWGLPEINWITSIVFEAGRITGIREERKRRKCTITEKP